MESCFGYQELKALQGLISAPKDHSDSEDDLPQAGARKLGPGDIGNKNGRPQQHSGPHAPLKRNDDDIWHSSEVDSVQNLEFYDPRKVPEYEMKFKQSVSAEDVFLGMGFKTPSTSSCEWLSISVRMPEETREKIELSVEPEAIDVRSPRYRLHLATPHPVDPNSSTAKWHGDNSTLEIVLRLVRELDDVNF
ncbi:dynein axonemal assembly factor 6 [Osmia bicornis bicornis]|uniref:dynein axonemal assembly factor 6 n=1 Tax=Osmia bicornis bicornis TaxID=1437191 RepID=UPI001EAF5CA1|nr:dynein axonemal assembly factor 6 [Osmia bicornis bicornis]